MLYGSIKYAEDLPYTNQIISDFSNTMQTNKRALTLGSLALSMLLGRIALSGMIAKSPEDAINKKETEVWAKQYLKGKTHVVPYKDLGNAFYTHMTNKNTGEKQHIVAYDPKFNKSVAAHEIGHGMSHFPRVPLSNLIAPALLSIGGYSFGTHLGIEDGKFDGLGMSLIGAGMLAPTLIDEYGASSNAKKILKDHNIKPRGLTRAWATYAAPLAVGVGALGAGYFTGQYYNNKLHQIDPNADFEFKG